MASKLDQLMAELTGRKTYTPLTPQEIQDQAQRRYQAVYDQKRLSARETYEQSDSALARELSALQDTYDERRAQAFAQSRQTYAQASRQSLNRGMQRSSYTGATLANISLAGDAALNAIRGEQARMEGDIAQQRTRLSQQYAREMEALNASQQADTLSYADELTAREYDRAAASRETADKLALQLYEYQHELEKEAAEQARWQAEFNAKYASSASSGGGRKKSAAQPSTAESTAKKTASASGVRKTSREMIY